MSDWHGEAELNINSDIKTPQHAVTELIQQRINSFMYTNLECTISLMVPPSGGIPGCNHLNTLTQTNAIVGEKLIIYKEDHH